MVHENKFYGIAFQKHTPRAVTRTDEYRISSRSMVVLMYFDGCLGKRDLARDAAAAIYQRSEREVSTKYY